MRKIYINFAITIAVVGLMIASILYLMHNSLFTVWNCQEKCSLQTH